LKNFGNKNTTNIRRLNETEDENKYDLKISVLTNKDGKLYESEDQKCEWLIMKLEPKSL
jgi:hypothetical protein